MDRYDKHFLFNFAFVPVSEEGECKRIHCIVYRPKGVEKDYQYTSNLGGVANGYFDVSTKRFSQ